MNRLRIIIAGSRDFKDYNLLSEKVMEFIESKEDDDFECVEFISGAARGADTLGEQFAYSCGYEVKRFLPSWDRLGKRAGYVRNAEMAKYAVENGNTGVLIAFWDGKSKGTKHMIDLAERYGLEVHIVRF